MRDQNTLPTYYIFIQLTMVSKLYNHNETREVACYVLVVIGITSESTKFQVLHLR